MVEPFDFKGHKQIKDAHAGSKAVVRSVLSGFGFTFAIAGAFLGYLKWGYPGILLGILAGIAAALAVTRLYNYIVEGVSSNAGRIMFIGPKANWSLYEKLESDMQQIRYAKHNERYGEALTKINQVLKKAPKWPEALYLKAEILWDGFEALEEAKDALRQAIKVSTPEDRYHGWSRQLFKKLSQIRQGTPQ